MYCTNWWGEAGGDNAGCRGRIQVSCKANGRLRNGRLRSERRRPGVMGAFSLTPALSRWERENARAALGGEAAFGLAKSGRTGSLSQRERVGVRENGSNLPTRRKKLRCARTADAGATPLVSSGILRDSRGHAGG